ncbi:MULTISPECIES: hypothetical protein [unclassified Salipiger]|uniref:hypothetical protein n=1 Tax=unclassified Salipiger TaxID=2640570 RepID=UPI0013BB7727|nr:MULTISPECIES: hypothetical protein [unclassified Salipiger]NDV52551.1 hypothetical protein [Salipiger sp. PrR003]NDW32720.1 hypothetical protein [Salipiger sp. PrR007]
MARSRDNKKIVPPGEAPRVIDQGSVWILVAAPSIWAAHFLLSYWVAAIWCAKLGRGTPLTEPRWIIAGLGALCIAAIIGLAVLAVRRYGGVFVIFEEITESSERARDRFVGHVALLLCVLSAVAILFTVIPGMVLGQC